MGKGTYRTPKLEFQLLQQIALSTEMTATTDDILTIGMNFIESMFDQHDQKVLSDTVRWTLIHMCDTEGWLSRPFGKLENGRSIERRAWLRTYRPHQKASQNVWRLTPKGQRHLQEASEEWKRIREFTVQDIDALESEESPPKEYFEGERRQYFANYYERDRNLRADAVFYHGTICQICGFDFEKVYGKHGEGYIEIHHIHPISNYKEPTKVDPIKDLIPICSNCHRMIHRRKDHVLSPEELRRLIRGQYPASGVITAYHNQ